MDKKLTLSLNERVTAKAMEYAKGKNISLSRMIENYLAAVVEQSPSKDEEESFTPLVDRLIGVIDLTDDQDKNFTKDHKDFLIDKYN